MTIRRGAWLIVWLTCLAAGSAVASQDALSTVRELYLSADYEGALAILDRLDGATRDAHTDFADYRVFCLLALERSDEARQAIQALVETDPFHQLSEGQASPRMRTVFQETRKALLPAIVQRMYANAKTSFDKGEPEAAHQFDRLIALLDDPDLKDAQLSDLRAVARGFRDLSKAGDSVPQPLPHPEQASTNLAVADGGGPKPVTPNDAAGGKPDTTHAGPTPASPLTGPPDTIRVTARGSSPVFTPKDPPPPGLEPPFPISQTMPNWSARGAAARQTYLGIVEVVIDEQGNVTSVALRRSILPSFDQALLKAARTWKYKPALFNGTPVSFVKVIEIQIQPER